MNDLDKIPEAPKTPVVDLVKMNEASMEIMKDSYQKYPEEYKAIMEKLKSASREYNAIRIKDITGEEESNET